jgi:hypothetical protein
MFVYHLLKLREICCGSLIIIPAKSASDKNKNQRARSKSFFFFLILDYKIIVRCTIYQTAMILQTTAVLTKTSSMVYLLEENYLESTVNYFKSHLL